MVPQRPEGRPKILVVEDEAIVAMDLERILHRLGFEVVGTADNGPSAIELVRETRPDLVLMDVTIRPPMDGIETARQLAGEAYVPPVVFLTAFSDDVTISRATQTSPYGYITKPFDERALLAAIWIAIGRHASEERTRLLASILDNVQVGVLLCDVTEGRLAPVLSNPAYQALAGHGALGPPYLLDAVGAAAAQVLSEGRATDVIASPDEGRWLTVHVAPMPKGGRVALFYTDITNLRRAENLVLDSRRLEMVWRMSAGVAHDFNNALSAVVNFVELAKERVSDEQVRADLEDARFAADRATELVRRMLDFTRADPSPTADLGASLKDALPLLSRLGKPSEVRLESQVSGFRVELGMTSLTQILMNLVANARDAIGARRGSIRIVAAPEGSATVRISVEDDGGGMPDEVRARVFEPLFTTKAKGKGTGLGLMMCRMLVERVGGAIGIESTEGVGTKVFLDLPGKPPTEVGTSGG